MEGDYQLTTPENVSVDYEIAGLGSRFVAAFIDFLILTVIRAAILVSVLVITGRVSLSSQVDGTVWAVAWIVVFALELIYPMLFEIVWNGQTPGKRGSGIRMIRGDGGPITGSAVVIRNVVRLVDYLPFYYIIGVVVMFIDKRSRRLGDLAAGTIAVKERGDRSSYRPRTTADATLFGAPTFEMDQAAAARLSADDRRLVQEFVRRRGELKPEAVSQLSFQLANRLAAKMGMNTPVAFPEAFLLDLDSCLERRQK